MEENDNVISVDMPPGEILLILNIMQGQYLNMLKKSEETGDEKAIDFAKKVVASNTIAIEAVTMLFAEKLGGEICG